MRRTNLVLDEHVLQEATRVLGAKTYSAAVNTALAEVIRWKKIQTLPSFFGSKIWEGDLAAMREDRPRRKPQRSPRKPRRSRSQPK
jgi:Bacterial antitoxin of type II TA system, VapB